MSLYNDSGYEDDRYMNDEEFYNGFVQYYVWNSIEKALWTQWNTDLDEDASGVEEELGIMSDRFRNSYRCTGAEVISNSNLLDNLCSGQPYLACMTYV